MTAPRQVRFYGKIVSSCPPNYSVGREHGELAIEWGEDSALPNRIVIPVYPGDELWPRIGFLTDDEATLSSMVGKDVLIEIKPL